MLGIITQIILSWVLVKWMEKKDLSVLGLTPSKKRLTQFLAGFLIGLLFVSAYWLAVSMITKNPFQLNPGYTIADFFTGLWFVFKSVAFEELIFRGVLLYILISRLGAQKALWISAIGFGIYHWFSYGIWGQGINMVFIFLITGLMGYVLALAFYKTRSIYLPLALHFGYNFTTMIIFSASGSIGNHLLIKSTDSGNLYPGGFSWLVMTLISAIGFPLLSWWYLGKIKPEKGK